MLAVAIIAAPLPLGLAAASAAPRVMPSTPAGRPAFWVYAHGHFAWPGDYSYAAVPDYRDRSGGAPGGFRDIKVTLTGKWGGWQPFSPHWSFNSRPYSELTFALKPTVAGQRWSCQFVKIHDVPVGISVDVARYGPAPVAGRWATYTIPLAALGVVGQPIYKFAIQDQTGRARNVWYIDNVGFIA
jgi:hypothetical protein